MVCIDWCDAKAYCSWAGKRLCGKIGGGQLSMDGRDDPAKLEGTNPNISEWGFACSQGAKTTYPYGNEHQEGACVDVSYRQDHKLALSSNADVKSDPSCHGQSPPYDALWDMVENVNEFEDGFSAPDVVGFRVAYKNGFTCDSEGALDISATNAQVGFRCCAD
jgi:formylglycine-generating enzyme required for sulfatase activity